MGSALCSEHPGGQALRDESEDISGAHPRQPWTAPMAANCVAEKQGVDPAPRRGNPEAPAAAAVQQRAGARFHDKAEVTEIELDGLRTASDGDVSPSRGRLRTGSEDSRMDSLRSKSMRSVERMPTYIDPNHGLRNVRSVRESSGQLTDTYELKDKLGEGGFGSVFRVKHLKTGQVFALKSIPVKNVEKPEVFERELNIARQLKHPGIVELHETFSDPEAYHLVMDLCIGGDCLDRVTSSCYTVGNTMHGGLETGMVARYAWQMLTGLAYVHGYKFAHRDVKPDNYMLTDHSLAARLKLIDFGLARSFEADEKLTSKVGTAAYVAPEVMASEKGYDMRCDIWSVGVTIYVLCAARMPFPGDNEKEVLKKVAKGSPPPFTDANWAKHPRALKELVQLLMTFDPAARPHAKEVLESNEWLKERHRCEEWLRAQGHNTGCCSVQ